MPLSSCLACPATMLIRSANIGTDAPPKALQTKVGRTRSGLFVRSVTAKSAGIGTRRKSDLADIVDDLHPQTF